MENIARGTDIRIPFEILRDNVTRRLVETTLLGWNCDKRKRKRTGRGGGRNKRRNEREKSWRESEDERERERERDLTLAEL